MTQEDRKLLLKDLCARLPYGVICEDMEGKTRPLFGITPTQHFIVTLDNATDGTNGLKFCTIDCIKPYLRPMSSMTEEETNEYNQCWEDDRDDIMIIGKHFEEMYKSKKFTLYMHPVVPMYRHILWLLEHHFDFMGLTPKGLAIEVTENNNPYKE